MTRHPETLRAAVLALIAHRRNNVPTKERVGGIGCDELLGSWLEAETELSDVEDEILYEQVHVEGRPFHKALLSLLMRRWALTKELLEQQKEA